MRLVLLVLILACLLIQYPLYLGSSGYKRVEELNQQLQAEREMNQALLARNNAMQAEIEDLETGTQALEDRARLEMSMIDSDEILVRILSPTEKEPMLPIRIAPPDSKQ